MCMRHRLNEGKLLYCLKKQQQQHSSVFNRRNKQRELSDCSSSPHCVPLRDVRQEVQLDKSSWGLSVQSERVKVVRLRALEKKRMWVSVCVCVISVTRRSDRALAIWRQMTVWITREEDGEGERGAAEAEVVAGWTEGRREEGGGRREEDWRRYEGETQRERRGGGWHIGWCVCVGGGWGCLRGWSTLRWTRTLTHTHTHTSCLLPVDLFELANDLLVNTLV